PLTPRADGKVIASIPTTGTLATSTRPVEVGGSQMDAGYLNGLLDDVRIYSRALSITEITADMSTAVDTTKEPVLSWDLEAWPAGADFLTVQPLRTAHDH